LKKIEYNTTVMLIYLQTLWVDTENY